MDYDSILKMVKQQNPKMPHKEAQKKASETFQKMKQAQAELKGEKPLSIKPESKKPAETKVPESKVGENTETKAEVTAPEPEEIIEMPSPLIGGINVDLLYQAEQRIRDVGVNRNSIIFHGQKAIPGGRLVIHGKDGVNKLVTFEDQEGNCIPINGYFKIFLP